MALDRNFPSTGKQQPNDTAETWQDRHSYLAASETLARAGVVAQPDGVERYVAGSREWEPLVRRVAPTLCYRMDEIDRRRSEVS